MKKQYISPVVHTQDYTIMGESLMEDFYISKTSDCFVGGADAPVRIGTVTNPGAY